MQRFLDAVTPDHLRPLGSPARWWLAVLTPPVAALFAAAVHGVTGGIFAPFSPFYLAVITTAAFGGVGPALLTLALTVLFVLTVGATFFGPSWQLFATEPVPLGLFILGCLLIIAITHQLQCSRVTARQVLARLQELQADVGMRLWAVDLADGELRASGQPLRLDGRTHPSPDGRLARSVWLATIHPEDRAGMLDRLQRAIDSGESRYEYEVRVPQPDGSMRWINSYMHVHRDSGGRATHLAAASIDVTPMRAARQAQAETEALLQVVSDSLPVLIAYATPDRRYRFNNKAYETWFGTASAALAGRSIEEVVGPIIYAGIRPHLDRAFAGETARFRSRLEYPGYGPRDVAATYVPHVVEGRVLGVVILVEDLAGQIAGEQRLRDSEERLRLAMEGARMGTWFSDIHAGRVVMDEAHLRLLGYDPQSPPPQTNAAWRECLHPDDLPRIQATLDAARRSVAPFDLELRIRRADDGSERWLALYGRFLHDGGESAAHQSIGVVCDITARKQAELALEQSHRRKDEFLATLAHELRNPLAPIRYAARLLRPEATAGVIVQVRDTIERQSTQMARLLDDLLDVSRITRNVIELRRESIDLRQVVEDSVEAARPLIDAMQHRLVLSLPGKPIWVEADRTRMSQIVSNLLQNAAKYTDPGGRIEVSVEEQCDQAALRVRDSGIGIAPEMRERVFEIFSQVRQPGGGGARSGLGIGLAIVRRLVELHGGRIEVDSAGLGQGAEFVVHLPLAVPQAGRPLNVVPLFSSGRRRLLVVDDNHDAADSLAAMLRLAGHAVQVAYDGASAMALAETARPDVILLDLGMPQTSGYDVARWVRRQPWGSSLRLIALTGWGQTEDRRRTREAGFDHHLTKPVDPDQLIAVLAEPPPEAGGQGAPATGN
ncbi:MAG: PAS domain-containing protein [Sinobacteraceae bacterium]|nr:PAS domain-containing protein [Nevskiaceae bacterium]